MELLNNTDRIEETEFGTAFTITHQEVEELGYDVEHMEEIENYLFETHNVKIIQLVRTIK